MLHLCEDIMGRTVENITPVSGYNGTFTGCFSTVHLWQAKESFYGRHACKLKLKSVADPGFPRSLGANPRGGAPTYDFAKFSQKTA